MNEKIITAIYIRVSTEEQAKEGFSINAQTEKLKAYALAKDWGIYDFYIDDGKSGKDLTGRPEINRMIKDVKDKKVNNVLIYKIDRLTRSTKNLIELVELFNEKDCAFNSLMESIDTSTATGRMFIKIIGIFAEFERENLVERISFGYEQKTREGNYTNANGVYGYDYIPCDGKDKGRLILNEYEKQIIKYIYDSYLSGESMTKICKSLIAQNTPTKRGGKWCQSTISSILTNPLYIGKIRYDVSGKRNNHFEVESTHEPIISEDTFCRANELMGKRKKYTPRRYPSENTYFLSVLFCDKCNMKLTSLQHKTNGVLYANYGCSNKINGNCNAKGFSHKKMEQAFTEYISKVETFTPENIKNDGEKNKKEELVELNKKLSKLKKQVSDLKSLFLEEKITFEEYRSFANEIGDKVSLIDKIIDKADTEEVQNIDYEKINDIIGNIKENWLYLDNKEKQEFIYQFIDKIKVHSENGKVVISDLNFVDTKTKTLK